MLDHSLTLTKIPALKGAFLVPALEPGYFLALPNQSDPGQEPSGSVADGSVTVYSEDRKPLFVVGGLEELKIKKALSWEKRIHYYPRAGLLVTLEDGKDRLVLRRIDLAEQLEKSETDYLVIVSRPPQAKPGTDFSYKLRVLSKKGGLKFNLRSGPEGMKISPAGEITWKVPTKLTEPAEVVLTVSDSSGQELFHEFKLEVTPAQGG